jgi:hypothetical protein
MVYIKTDSGRSAIRDRSNGLSPRARSVFLLFDGTRTLQEVLQLTSGTAEDVEKLVLMGMLARVENDSGESASPALEEKTVPAALMPQDSGMDHPTHSAKAISARPRTGPSPAQVESTRRAPAPPALEEETVPAALLPQDAGMNLPTLSTRAIPVKPRTGISPAQSEKNSREPTPPAWGEKTVPAALMPRDSGRDLPTLSTKATLAKAIPAKPRTAMSPSGQQLYSKAHPIALRLTADLGLKGFRLNLAVEAASDVDELKALAPTIAAAVGVEKSRELKASLGY